MMTGIGHLLDSLEALLGISPFAEQVGVVEDDQAAEHTAEVREVVLQSAFPDGLACGLRDKQGDTLAFLLDQHSMSIRPTKVLPRPTPSHRKAPPCWPAIFRSSWKPSFWYWSRSGTSFEWCFFPLLVGHLVARKNSCSDLA